MANKRIFYASHAVKVGNATVNGAQSVAVNTNFNLENIFQLGRLSAYELISVDPDVEITITKALDGYNTVYNLATTGGGAIVENANDTTTVIVAVGEDTNEALNDQALVSSITMTGCFISSINYTIPVEGNMIEEVVLVGSHKELNGAVANPNADPNPHVLRRQNLHLANCVFPTELGDVINKTARLSNISISASLNREKMFALGQVSPFHRFVNFPIEITVAFDLIAVTNNDGVVFAPVENECEPLVELDPQDILINLCNSASQDIYTFDFRANQTEGEGKAYLQSTSYSGGDTGGGNVTTTYTYIVYNDLSITG
jgi:hypothetical protein